MNLFESMNKGFEKKYLANRKSLNEAFRPALDEVLDVLDIAGFDIDRDDVKAYAEAAAEYIEMAREAGNHYSAAQWYKDTKANYPEDLEVLKTEVVEEACDGKMNEETNMEKLQKKFPELMEARGGLENKIVKFLQKRENNLTPDEIKKLAKFLKGESEREAEEDPDIDVSDMDEEVMDALVDSILDNTFPDDSEEISLLNKWFDGEEYEESLKKSSKKPIKEDLGDDIADYQRWVDYDMKRYGKISDITNDHIKKAGLTITKNDHGDYEVIAKED